jgi:hypothetical protein
MTRDEAIEEAARRNAVQSESGVWSAKEGDDATWGLVHVTAPGLARIRPTGSHEESRPKPAEPPDPRPSIVQNIPPYGGAV